MLMNVRPRLNSAVTTSASWKLPILDKENIDEPSFSRHTRNIPWTNKCLLAMQMQTALNSGLAWQADACIVNNESILRLSEICDLLLALRNAALLATPIIPMMVINCDRIPPIRRLCQCSLIFTHDAKAPYSHS